MSRRMLWTATLVAMLAASSAFAATAGRMTAEIPFDFLVNGKKLAAGEYTLTETASGVLQLRGEDGRAAAVVTRPLEYGLDPSVGKLVFNRFSGQYVLVEFWARGSSREVPGGREAPLMARNASDEEPIVVAVALNRR